MGSLVHGLGGTLGGVWRAIRARPGIFLGVALAVILLDLVLPVFVLSVFRKPYDHFSFNPWLVHAPAWALSPHETLARKWEFLSNVSLLWFIASSPYDAPEWGFSVGVPDLVRWLYTGALFGAYFALWFYARGIAARGHITLGRYGAVSGRGGFVGAALSTLGLATSPCSVAGCGLPLLPVMGLALQGLTSGALAALTAISHVATLVVLAGMTLAVVALGWMVRLHEPPPDRVRQGGTVQENGLTTALGGR